MARELDSITPPVGWGLPVLMTTIFVLCFGLMGTLDYQDEVLEADHYCRMVHQKLWVDYRGTYAAECKNGRFIRANGFIWDY